MIEQQAKKEILKLKKLSIKELNELFTNGKVPLYENYTDKTRGSFLELSNNKYYFLEKLLLKIFFNGILGRWVGKEFTTKFSEKETGIGVNLFKNKFMPYRFPFKTYIKKSYYDQKPCLTLDYRKFMSLVNDLVDDVKEIEDGVLLGQMYYKYPWKKEPEFLGYFTLIKILE